MVSSPVYRECNTPQPPQLRMLYIIRAPAAARIRTRSKLKLERAPTHIQRRTHTSIWQPHVCESVQVTGFISERTHTHKRERRHIIIANLTYCNTYFIDNVAWKMILYIHPNRCMHTTNKFTWVPQVFLDFLFAIQRSRHIIIIIWCQSHRREKRERERDWEKTHYVRTIRNPYRIVIVVLVRTRWMTSYLRKT